MIKFSNFSIESCFRKSIDANGIEPNPPLLLTPIDISIVDTPAIGDKKMG